MLFRLWIPVLLRHSKIHHVDYISRLRPRSTNEKVIGLDIAVYEVLFVDCLNSRELFTVSNHRPVINFVTYHLLRHHHHGLCRESSIAVIKKIFEGRAQQVNDQNVVEALLAEVVDIRDTSYLESV